MKKMRIAINGFGRIGRAVFKVARSRHELDVVAVNDLGSIENFAYLLKYDTVYGRSDFDVSVTKDKNAFVVDGKEISYISEKDPVKLPWKALAVDVVVESTGLFTSFEKAKVHLDAGAKRVVISAPAKDEPSSVAPGATVLLGINEKELENCLVSSNASCTTNAGSPLLAILDEAIGIEKAILNTVHGYTASQSLVDGPSRKPARPDDSGHSGGDVREGRAAAQNIVPSSTGAAIATAKALRQFEGKFDGISIRVPVPAGSIVDVTFIAKRPTSKDEVNDILTKASKTERWKDIFSVTNEPLVSTDILGSRFASIADLEMTRVVDGTLVKVLGWYDNEMGYTHTLVEHVIKAARLI